MRRLLRSEIYRLVRRWMPWILIAMMVLLPFVLYELIWVTSSAQLQLLRGPNPPSTPGAPPPDVQIRNLEQAIQSLRPSRVTELGSGLVQGLGSILVIVVAASHVGTEWAWGTLRTVLAAGAGRIAFLASKYVTLIGFAILFLAFGLSAAVVASFAVSTQAGLDTTGLDLTRVAEVGARSLYGFLPYMALAALIAGWFRSAGGGIAAGLVIYFTESLAVQLLVSFNRDFVTIANLGLSRNVQAISRLPGQAVDAGPPQSILSTLPDQGQAVLMLAAWTLIFVALAAWRLRTRDVTLA